MSQDPARARFFVIQAARVSGVVLTLLGMAVWESDLVQPGGAPGIGATGYRSFSVVSASGRVPSSAPGRAARWTPGVGASLKTAPAVQSALRRASICPLGGSP